MTCNKRWSWAWSYEVCKYSLPKIHLFLQATNPPVAPTNFLLAAGDVCVLLITKIWLVRSCSCCRALLQAGWPFFIDIPCTHGVCFLILGSFVPVMFLFSTKLEKAKWFLFSYSKARQDCGAGFYLACVNLCSKIGLLSLARGSIFQPSFLKTWWWCLAKWFSVEICKGIWEFQLLANLPWA